MISSLMMFGVRFRMALYGIAFIALAVAIAMIVLGHESESMLFFYVVLPVVGIVLIVDALLKTNEKRP